MSNERSVMSGVHSAREDHERRQANVTRRRLEQKRGKKTTSVTGCEGSEGTDEREQAVEGYWRGTNARLRAVELTVRSTKLTGPSAPDQAQQDATLGRGEWW